jgi:hypothetical protein
MPDIRMMPDMSDGEGADRKLVGFVAIVIPVGVAEGRGDGDASVTFAI